jgi:hypothetical protein
MIPKITGAQRDFSGGELDEAMKRADDNPLTKIGCRQLANWRILCGGQAQNRPGRRALFAETGRVDEVLMSPGNTFYLVFGNGYLRVYNAVGTLVFNTVIKGDGTTAIPWTLATVKNIVWAITASADQYAIYICYGDGAPANVPQVLTWDGVSQTSTWTLTTFSLSMIAGQKRTFFYRIMPQNITMQPSAISGNIDVTFSSPVLYAGMVGSYFSYAGAQLVITAVTGSGFSGPPSSYPSQYGTATVVETLPPSQTLALSSSAGVFNLGNEIEGATTGAIGIVTAVTTSGGSKQQQLYLAPTRLGFSIGTTITGITSGATGTYLGSSIVGGLMTITVQLLTTTVFGVEHINPGNIPLIGVSAVGSTNDLVVQLLQNATGNVIEFAAETIAGPSGSGVVSGTTNGNPQAIDVWNNEVMNGYYGWPLSVFYDQNRLGFCNFPSVPSGIGWSAIGLPSDMLPLAQPDNAIFELTPSKSQVLFVQPGMESSEFVFCDNVVFYIPITVTNPLVPGSVAFNQLSAQGCAANVQPRAAEQTIIYVKAGSTMIGAVQAPGAYYRPYVIDFVSEFHSHLFTASPPIALAIPPAPNQFEELYAYVLLANGTLVVGKYGIRQGLMDIGPDNKPKVGWLPWSGAGTVSWVSALNSDMLFTTVYGSVGVVEILDNNQYVDGALFVNNLPAPFAPPGGKGPLYNFPGPNSSVMLIDQGTRVMGTYKTDANGNIIPQFLDGENLTSAQLVAGQPWTATLEPFPPDAPPGQSVHQRMFKRRVSRMATYVSNSTGFLFARLFSGPITPTSPALGTVMNNYRVTTYNQGDVVTNPPPLREQAYRWRPLGRSFDPRVAIIKDSPGPVILHEIGLELTT